MTIRDRDGKIVFVAETADAKQEMLDSPGGIMEGVERDAKSKALKITLENNLKKVVDKWLVDVIK